MSRRRALSSYHIPLAGMLRRGSEKPRFVSYTVIIFLYILSSQCPIVERLTNSLMMHGRNNGKKMLAIRIVQHAFEIIHLLTGEVSANNTMCIMRHHLHMHFYSISS